MGFLLFITMSRPALGFTQLPIQWMLGVLTPRVKWWGCEADHSPPSNVEVKNVSMPPFCDTSSWWVGCLVKHRDFTFFFPYWFIGYLWRKVWGCMRNADKLWFRKCERKRLVKRPRQRKKDNIRLDLRGGWAGVGWIQLAENKHQC